MIIDLHGYNVEETTATLINALFAFQLSYDQKLEIITGKGNNIVMLTTLNILDEENWEYKILEGKIIVWKNEVFEF